jgi:hypothetical protein
VCERTKDAWHVGLFDTRAWVLVPFVHESFGRLGRRARWFLAQLAAHVATVSGGSAVRIRSRRGELLRRFMTELTYALVRANAERLLAYVRGACLAGRACHPVSSVLAITE